VILQRGCSVVVAPSFYLRIDWPRRLLLAAGVEREGAAFFPRSNWRPPDDREVDLLTRQGLADCLSLFQLPRHLFTAWGRLLERAGVSGEGRLEGFDAFVADVAEFLAFKDLPVPEGAAFDLLVSTPGLRSLPRKGMAPGLTFSLAAHAPYPVEGATRWPRLWGGVNLGEESTSLLFINLLAAELLAELRRRYPDPFAPSTLAELADRFLTLCPDYPPVRLRIEPGEGFRLPAAAILVDGCTLDKTEPDLLLQIRHPGQEV
jgi:hypothetical protein